MKIGSIYKSNKSGEFKVVSISGCFDVGIEFIKTGYKTNTRKECVLNGNVKDLYHPRINGVGFFGDGEYKGYENKTITKAYSAWRNMLNRCYNTKYHKKHPTYADCYVSSVWHNFQNFAEWFYANYTKGLHMDKDIKINGNKVYGPDSCLFVTRQENNEKAWSRNYKFTSPEGDVVELYNLSKFCRDNNLSVGCMCEVFSGNKLSHKGWRK